MTLTTRNKTRIYFCASIQASEASQVQIFEPGETPSCGTVLWQEKKHSGGGGEIK